MKKAAAIQGRPLLMHFDVVMHSNKQSGQKWWIHSKSVTDFHFILNFVIWNTVLCN